MPVELGLVGEHRLAEVAFKTFQSSVCRQGQVHLEQKAVGQVNVSTMATTTHGPTQLDVIGSFWKSGTQSSTSILKTTDPSLLVNGAEL